MFNAQAGTHLLHVAYKGVGPALNALMGGEIQVMFVPATVTVQHIQSGKLRAIAFTGSKRWSGMPEVPTVAETLPGFDVSGSWHAWFAPAKTPRAIVEKIHRAVAHALQQPKIRDFIKASGYEPDGRAPAETAKFMALEVKRYAEQVKQAKIEVR
jgi:tripartite-type tricarboxylate transporter receptor subunit TctC